MSANQQTPPLAWTASQRRALLVLLVGLFLFLAVRYALNPVYVSDPQPTVPARFADLADRIDPNVADWQALAVLPAIGEKRAKQIVAYREDYAGRHGGRLPFRRPDDLQLVRGIGPVTADALRPYLIFPAPPASTTRPSAH
jgi:DNA uptake protein ComE-like DNA-binding protein